MFGLCTNDGSKYKMLDLTFKALEGLEQFSESLCCELFMVLGSHLNTDLQVLADVGWEHGPEALQWIFHWQWAKVVHQPLEVQEKMLV